MKSLKLFLIGILLTGFSARGAETPALPESGKLTLVDARALALKTHPRITVAELRILAAREGVTEARAGFLPFISANATAVGTGETLTRIGAGSLSNSQIYDHAGVGVTVNQLITDFGRTSNLTDAAREQARAAEAGLLATRAQLLLAVDDAYFAALEARAVKEVAKKTLEARQSLYDQVSALAQNQLKSNLDVRFARVGVDEARLLVDQARGDWQSALATLANLVGWKEPDALTTALVEEPFPESTMPADINGMISRALSLRPELVGLRAERDSAHSLAQAARDARNPTISLFGTAGLVPVGDEHFENEYAAGGVNVNLPLFTGGLYRAKQREAELKAREVEASLTDQENNISRDVRLAWIDADHARERAALTASLLANANEAFDLAKARFDQGLGSIVELNQAQLAQTSAAIGVTNAEYDYRIKRDVLAYQIGIFRR